ncbi:PhzF family phenazine biosynthesis protein [Novosphingobium sp. 9]|uniref:PhzF family phenazine biosynthesis protein n=1 Tax=Novosphingobium sp. 9 TaxID=2025349 RepID=UPI0021B59A0F|nr:PhzF family phenazine biosynthesis protein [Novosphingobium sp. 9]
MKIDLIDVFPGRSLGGNPLAVVHGAEGLDEAAMLRLTRWLGFSETTFLLPPTDPQADYRVQIFFPAGELPFAGHPTLGSAYAWLAAGGVPKSAGTVVQECGIGLVDVQTEGATAPARRLAFAAPALTRSGPLDEAERAEAIRLAGVAPEAVVEAVHVANGPKWQLLRLRSAADVLAARPAPEAPLGTDIGLAAPGEAGSGIDWELRAFFANQHGSLTEDPVTGSFNAGVAVHLFGTGLVDGSYTAAQGRMVGAEGRIFVSRDESGVIWIGGDCAMISQGGALTAFA